MNDKEKIKEFYKYFLYSTIAWDNYDRKVEDDPINSDYFISQDYKKYLCKDLNTMRKKNVVKISYLGNNATSTNYNVIEKNDKEIVIAFRGSDSKQDWISDFSFFHTQYKEHDEGVEDLIMDEYIKSQEAFGLFDFFKDTKLKNFNEVFQDSSNIVNDKLQSIISIFSNKIKFHGGFVSQYNSVKKDVNTLFDSIVDNPKYEKISIVGHSLGSSLAQLCYIFQSCRFFDKKEKFQCYVYGTPKIGNIFLKNFIKSSGFSNNLHICNIDSDLVAALPPNNLGFFSNPNELEFKSIKAPFKTKFNHTLFYYIFCFKNFAPYKIKPYD